MKRPFVLIAAIVAIIGLGTAVAVANENIKVWTSVGLKFKGPDRFSGTVKAEKKVCEKGRMVYVNLHNEPIGGDKTDDRGKYRVFFDEDTVQHEHVHHFAAAAIQKTVIKDNGDKIVCKPGRSKRVAVP